MSYVDATLAAYRRCARTAIDNWRRHDAPSRFLRRFAGSLSAQARVLDYGCGIGTDLGWLRRRGFRVDALDGTMEFVREARRRCPGVRVRRARFETARLGVERYDGIWCNAALIHVTPAALRAQLRRLRAALKPGAVLGVSLAWGRIRGLTRRDWIPGRYVAAYSKRQAAGFFTEWEISSLRVVSRDGRQGRWIQVLANRRAGDKHDHVLRHRLRDALRQSVACGVHSRDAAD